jgi:hypothetical protein
LNPRKEGFQSRALDKKIIPYKTKFYKVFVILGDGTGDESFKYFLYVVRRKKRAGLMWLCRKIFTIGCFGI